MAGNYLFLLPLLLLAALGSAFTVAYAISVAKRTVYPFWPFISDTGAKPPESCIFGQLLNIAGFIAAAIMVVRFKLVQAFNNHTKVLVYLNYISFFIGLIASLGLSMVGNFQESTVLTVHVIAAMMVFVGGVIYSFLQSYITRRMYPMYNGYTVFVMRLLISFLSAIALVMTSVFQSISMQKLGRPMTPGNLPVYFNQSMPGYPEHVVSAVSEWVMGFAFIAFFLTYTNDFKKISMRIVSELLVSHLDENPVIRAAPTERTGLLA